MAADVNPGGVAVQASNSSVYAVAASVATVLFAALLKFLLDISGRQATAHAGEKATLMTLYGNLEARYGKLEANYTTMAADLATVKANYDVIDRANKALFAENTELKGRIGRRDRQVKDLADEVTIIRQEKTAETAARQAAESAAARVQNEINLLLAEGVPAGQPPRYPPVC